MAKTLSRAAWAPGVYQALDQLIKTHAHQPEAYVVFDFDNTTIMMDIEDNWMMYSLHYLLYQMCPQDFRDLLLSVEDIQSYYPLQDRPTVTLEDLALDICDQYDYLYDHYLSLPPADRPSLADIHQTEAYLEFRAKLRAFYLYVNTQLSRQAGKVWQTYWFQGMTPAEFRRHGLEMLKTMSQWPFERLVFESPASLSSRAGQVQSSFDGGLTYPVELVDLYATLQANGIRPYIISASPQDLVEVAATDYFHLVDSDQIYAMHYQLDEEGLIQAQMAADQPITKAEGKTQVIEEILKPRHQNHVPLALFGDSIGDWHMMQTYADDALLVVFNRLGQDEFADWVQASLADSKIRLYLQGRDNRSGRLRPEPTSLHK